MSRRVRSLRKSGRKIRRVIKKGGQRISRMSKRIKRRSVRRTRSLRKSRRISRRGGKRKTKRSLRGGEVPVNCTNAIIEETQNVGKNEVWEKKQKKEKGHFYIRKKDNGTYRLDIICKSYNTDMKLGSNILTYNVNISEQEANVKAIVLDGAGTNPFNPISGIAKNEVEAVHNLVNNLNNQTTTEAFKKGTKSYKGIVLKCNLDDSEALYRPLYSQLDPGNDSEALYRPLYSQLDPENVDLYGVVQETKGSVIKPGISPTRVVMDSSDDLYAPP